MSAHIDPSQPGSTVNWQALADGPAALVVLMAVGKLTETADALIMYRRAGDTPVACVANATLPTQSVLVSTLEPEPEPEPVAVDAVAAGVRPPAVVIIGEVVRLRDRLTP